MSSDIEAMRPVDLGNSIKPKMFKLPELMIEARGASSKLLHRPLPNDDSRSRKADIDLTLRILNWRSHTPLRGVLEQTIAWFDTTFSSNAANVG